MRWNRSGARRAILKETQAPMVNPSAQGPRRLAEEQGQALVEFALIAPLLFAILGGVLYCGAMAVTQQNLATAARYVARQASFTATAAGLQQGRTVQPPSAQYAAALNAALPNARQFELLSVDWKAVRAKAQGRYEFDVISGNVAQLKFRKRLLIGGKAYQAGLGVTYYGATVNAPMKDLAPLARNLTKIVTPGVSATSVMPGELAPRGTRGKLEGILELNDWIARLASEPVRKVPL